MIQKKNLLLLLVLIISFSICEAQIGAFDPADSLKYAGQSGVIHVSVDPDDIGLVMDQDSTYDSMLAWDYQNKVLYGYHPDSLLGARWNPVAAGSLILLGSDTINSFDYIGGGIIRIGTGKRNWNLVLNQIPLTDFNNDTGHLDSNLTENFIWVGNNLGKAAGVMVSGAIAHNGNGVFSINPNTIDSTKVKNGSIKDEDLKEDYLKRGEIAGEIGPCDQLFYAPSNSLTKGDAVYYLNGQILAAHNTVSGDSLATWIVVEKSADSVRLAKCGIWPISHGSPSDIIIYQGVNFGTIDGNVTEWNNPLYRTISTDSIEILVGYRPYKNGRFSEVCDLVEKQDSVVLGVTDTIIYNFVINGKCAYDTTLTYKKITVGLSSSHEIGNISTVTNNEIYTPAEWKRECWEEVVNGQIVYNNLTDSLLFTGDIQFNFIGYTPTENTDISELKIKMINSGAAQTIPIGVYTGALGSPTLVHTSTNSPTISGGTIINPTISIVTYTFSSPTLTNGTPYLFRPIGGSSDARYVLGQKNTTTDNLSFNGFFDNDLAVARLVKTGADTTLSYNVIKYSDGSIRAVNLGDSVDIYDTIQYGWVDLGCVQDIPHNNEVDAVFDYADFRTYNDTLAELIIVQKEGIEGVFKKSYGTDDGGVYIEDANSQIWERVFEKYVSVRWYDPVANGVADDYLAFKAALDYAENSDKINNVYVPTGSYAIATGLAIPSNTNFFGDGMGQTIIVGHSSGVQNIFVSGGSASAVIGVIGGDNVTIRDFTLDKQTNNINANGISFTPLGTPAPLTMPAGKKPNNCILERVEVLANVSPAGSYQIWNQGGERIQILNNVIRGIEGTIVDGIEVYGGNDVLIDGNTVINAGSAGIWLFNGGDITATVSNVRIVNNFIDGSDRTRFGLYANFGADVKDVLYNNNTIVNCTETSLGFSSENGLKVENFSMSNNTVRNSGGNGIVAQVGGTNINTKNISIQQNQIYRTIGDGIVLSNVANVIVGGNIVDTANIGINILTGSSALGTNYNINNNSISNVQKTAIYAQGANDLKISNNFLRKYNLEGGNSNYGIHLPSVAEVEISSNSFLHSGVETKAVLGFASRVNWGSNILLYTALQNKPYDVTATTNNTLSTPTNVEIVNQVLTSLQINGLASSTDENNWAWQTGVAVGSGVMRLRALNDAKTSGQNALIIKRTGINTDYFNFAGNVYTSQTGKGFITKSADGSCWKIQVDNSGVLSAVGTTCPN